MIVTNNIIEFIEGQTSISLSSNERKWITDHCDKANLHFEHDKSLFIKLEDIDASYQQIIQDGYRRKFPSKFDKSRHALVVSYSGAIQLYVSNQP